MDNASFDDIIRKTMSEGSEAVPEGLWAGISERVAAETASPSIWAAVAAWIRSHAALTASLATAACALVAAAIVWPIAQRDNVNEELVAETVSIIDPAPVQENAFRETDGSQLELPATLTNATAQAARPIKRRVPPTENADKAENTGKAAGTAKAVKDVKTLPSNEQAPQTDDQAAKAHKVPTNKKEKVENASFQPMPEDIERKKSKIDISASVNSAGSTGNAGKNMRGAHLRTSHDCGSDGKLQEKDALSYMIPIKAGIAVRWNIGEKFAVGTGVNYTFLTRRLSGSYDNGAIEAYDCGSITNNQHYLGIPINFYYTFLNKNRFSMYATVGGAAERCLGNTYSFRIDTGINHFNKIIREKVSGMQYSVSAGIGGQYSFTDHIALYVDPSICYYFQNNQPKSIRTTQPLQIGCDLGLRFNF